MASRPTVVTDASEAASKDAAGRTRQYLILMGIRVACILIAFFIPGWPKWLVIAGAVVLPGIAVLLANQPNQKKLIAAEHHDEVVGPAITDGSYQVIPGELDEGDPQGDGAHGAGPAEPNDSRGPGGRGRVEDPTVDRPASAS